MAFNIGLSGIRAASNDLSVTGNNIANASTTGFKISRAEFGDVYTRTLLGTGSNPIGSGVMTENVRQLFQQGNITGTSNSMDMAIDGNGFFVVKNAGTTTYTRAGVFEIYKDGYITDNSGARLQGYAANSAGVIGGVLGDMHIEVTNHAPRLTNLVSAIYNLNAGATVLQEQGKKLVSNGLAVGVANSGLAESTTSTLRSEGQPTSGGTPASVTSTLNINALTTASTIQVDIGNGPQPIDLSGLSSPATLTSLQQAINQSLGSQQVRAALDGADNIILQRDGYNATNGGSISATFNGTAGTTQAGTPGSLLFVDGSSADFRSVPGTSTTIRTTATPPLNIVTANAGTGAVVSAPFTAGSTGNISITINGQAITPVAVAAGDDINAVAANLTAALGAAGISATVAPNPGNTQLVITSGVPGSSMVVTSDNPTMGFTSLNATGTSPVAANNSFIMTVQGAGGLNISSNITIPVSNYASVGDLANAIQAQVNMSPLNGYVSVSSAGGKLVFSNVRTGQTESITFAPTTAAPNALSILGLNPADMVQVLGTNEVDKTNSFRINLSVPAPDVDNRSGSVEITLDENYRSVQQLAASINRQLASQSATDYIGVQAFTVEIEPKVVPAQYRLELRATESGEASMISITNVMASGNDVSLSDIFGLLQANPSNGTLLTEGIEGVNNQYPQQTVTITDPKGNAVDVVIPERSEANEIVALFNKQPGIIASAETNARIPVSSYNSPSRQMTLVLNGQELVSKSLPDMVKEINNLRATTLPGFKASLDANGDLLITNEIGRDIDISVKSPVVSDSIVLQGRTDAGSVVLGGTATADRSGSVGGVVTFVLNEGYSMSNPDPSFSGLFGALDESEFEHYVINAFDPADQNTYNHATPTTIYDSLGNAHVMMQYFVKEPMDPTRPDGQNVWAMYVMIDGHDVGDPDPTLPFPQNLEPTRARFELFFNQDGTLNTTATGDINITNWDPRDSNGDLNGALGSMNVLEGGLPLSEPPSNSNFKIDLAGTTQFGSAFSVNDSQQNGYATGLLTGLDIDSEGIVFARFSNGQAQVLGQVALANFRNPEGLTPAGSTGWVESYESGSPSIGTPRSGTLGQIRASALEDSNVDLSEQLVQLIIAQRNFQASSKTISTMDEITQTILNI